MYSVKQIEDPDTKSTNQSMRLAMATRCREIALLTGNDWPSVSGRGKLTTPSKTRNNSTYMTVITTAAMNNWNNNNSSIFLKIKRA